MKFDMNFSNSSIKFLKSDNILNIILYQIILLYNIANKILLSTWHKVWSRLAQVAIDNGVKIILWYREKHAHPYDIIYYQK